MIGAGPAGSATAAFLATCGYDVVLLDHAHFPRRKPCGDYLTPGAVRILRDELGALPDLEASGAADLSRETIVCHNGRSFGGSTQAMSCPRSVTDQILLDTARRRGVHVHEGFHARRVAMDGSAVIGVEGEDADRVATRVQARVTVGADGTRSLLARSLGGVRPIPRLQRIALQGYFLGNATDDTPGVTMHLPADGSDACCGFGAPSGPERTRNVNIVVPISEATSVAGRPQEYFDERLRRSFPQVWEQLQGSPQVGALRSVGCFGHTTRRAAQDGAVLVGDAATFINPFTGEGVYFALRGARLAADAIDGALRSHDTSYRTLRRYDLARRKELTPRYKLCDAVQRLVHSPAWLAWAAERLRRSSDLTESILRTVGDLEPPRDLFTIRTLGLALKTF